MKLSILVTVSAVTSIPWTGGGQRLCGTLSGLVAQQSEPLTERSHFKGLLTGISTWVPMKSLKILRVQPLKCAQGDCVTSWLRTHRISISPSAETSSFSPAAGFEPGSFPSAHEAPLEGSLLGNSTWVGLESYTCILASEKECSRRNC